MGEGMDELAPEKGIPATLRRDAVGNCHLGIEWYPEALPPLLTDRVAWIPIDPDVAQELGLPSGMTDLELTLVAKPRT